MKRPIITIDETKCNGCGLCIPNCPEGAIQIIDGKARLISDLFCDGLGACIGHCPEGAISIIEREATPYDERQVMCNIIAAGPNTIRAHLQHLLDHGELQYYDQACTVLRENQLPVPIAATCASGLCQAAWEPPQALAMPAIESTLHQWPVQLQLLNPLAPFFNNADLLIAADCVPFAYANFHQDFLSGRILIIFCPKLDQTIQNYIDKLTNIFSLHQIKSITILRMEVPCCGGVELIVRRALTQAHKDYPLTTKIVTIKGYVKI